MTRPHLGNYHEDFLTGVTADGTNDAWAVGYSLYEVNTGTLMHWNGSVWSTPTSITDGVDTHPSNNLYAVAAVSSSSIWAAGLYDGAPLIWHTTDSGSNWTQVPAENPAGTGSAFYGISIYNGSGNILAVGAQTSSSTVKTLIERPRPPLILIPGIMGSNFAVNSTFNPHITGCDQQEYNYNQGDTVWLDLTRFPAYTCGYYLDVLELQNNGQTDVYSQLGVKDSYTSNNSLVNAVDPLNGKNIGYHDALAYLENTNSGYPGYTLGQDLFVFPYDWRKDVDNNITALDNLINTATQSAGTAKVDIMAHSLGGLVARDYISNSSRAQRVHTLVELGTPHAGTPQFVADLLYPFCIKWLGRVCFVNQNEANTLVQNFTGGFELMPSKLYYQLYPNKYLYPFNDGRDLDHNGVVGPLNYDQLNIYLANLGKNKVASDAATVFHNNLDPTYSNTNGVSTYMIAGSGLPTIGQIFNYVWNDSGTQKADAIAIDGDGTVATRSATLNQSNSVLDNVFYVKEKHEDLVATGSALTMAVNLLNGQTSTISGVQTTPFKFKGQIISVHSPVELDAYDDQNNHTGSTSAGFEENIPGSIYDEIGDAKFIYLPDGGSYHITTKATAAGSFDLKEKTYDNSELTKQNLYLNVLQNANTTSSMSLDNNNTTLSVDVNGDGTNIQSVSPTYSLTGDAALDYAPPFTTASLSPAPNSQGQYSDLTTVTLNATASAGFSIANTYYTVDSGSQQTYSSPFTVSGTGDHTITYWSVDNEGLTEAQNTKTFTIHSTQSYNDDVLSDGAIGYWTLSNATGSNSGLTDQTSTHNNMSETDVTHGASKINTSADYSDSFNGTSSSTFASSIGMTLYTATQNFSIESWVKPTSIPSQYDLSGIAGKNGSYWLLLNGPHLSFNIRQGGTNHFCDDTNTATANTVYHLVGTYDGSHLKLYVNGSLACSQSLTGDADMNSGGVVTGSWDTSVLFMQGYISNVAIYDSVLTLTQISTHYNDGKL